MIKLENCTLRELAGDLTAASALLLVTAAKVCDRAVRLRGHPDGDH